jgi:hypothetical protein
MTLGESHRPSSGPASTEERAGTMRRFFHRRETVLFLLLALFLLATAWNRAAD